MPCSSKPIEDKVTQISLEEEAHPKPIFISESLAPFKKEDIIHLTRKYIDVFAQKYEDMPILDPQVSMHHLNINPDANPIKKEQRRFCPEIMEAIKSKIKKLIDPDFIREEQHPNWIANIVPVIKKNEKIRICIDFYDMNAAYPKDKISLSIINIMIGNMCEFERMSFIDNFLGYNQINMYP